MQVLFSNFLMNFSKIIQNDFKLSMKRGLKANLLEEVLSFLIVALLI